MKCCFIKIRPKQRLDAKLNAQRLLSTFVFLIGCENVSGKTAGPPAQSWQEFAERRTFLYDHPRGSGKTRAPWPIKSEFLQALVSWHIFLGSVQLKQKANDVKLKA